MAENHRRWDRQISVVEVDIGAADPPHLDPGNQSPRLRVEDGSLFQRQRLVEGAENSCACHCCQRMLLSSSASEARQFQGSPRKPARASSTSNLSASQPRVTISRTRSAYAAGEKSLPARLPQERRTVSPNLAPWMHSPLPMSPSSMKM